MDQNFPNPFNSETEIKFEITEKNIYGLEIYNILGEKEEEIFKGELNPGIYKINYKAYKITSGVYFYRLISNKFFVSKKFILLK